MYKSLKFEDLILCIFEVPKMFPTGFMMQPLSVEPSEVAINGAEYANLNVKSWIVEFKQLLENPSDDSSIKALHDALI
eukprot:CAMPEP_0185597728 /NCGR_PEP_ID=MMETSP0434-20130131/81554_1 /TAXON_ID=626734 ORGANISM="Favella taraikaensis, Strain Fe Narragansett Bay" /NCGR_SAMPLE_ID=MMETSP0434 /ASSEMBLY_ACC=CAM_ASM_000379 /LENGTH=77 /DNA_ID=CAMNT_0028226535 /DNA_START=1063 /DNA_END=1296 /DNA_ORIENTATION=-